MIPWSGCPIEAQVLQRQVTPSWQWALVWLICFDQRWQTNCSAKAPFSELSNASIPLIRRKVLLHIATTSFAQISNQMKHLIQVVLSPINLAM